MPTFHEIAHSGGTITITVATDAEGNRSYQQTYSGSRPNALAMIGVWALRQGIPIASADLGFGADTSGPPIAGCYMVMIASDSLGKFGHHCQACSGYWRSGPFPRFCPYCRFQDESFNFLSNAQRLYVAHYCDVLNEAMHAATDKPTIIDMDAVADAVGQEGEKPAFYVSEESQQHKFECLACGEFNDVIGRFAYCSACASRNDAASFQVDMEALRRRIKQDNTGSIVRDAVSCFDTIVNQYAKQFLSLIPLTRRRAERLRRGRYHDLEQVAEILRWFDIDILAGLSPDEVAFLKRQFFRRHVYEHNGGEIDQTYIDNSGDSTVRLKQHISESVEDVHRLISGLNRVARNLNNGFHELLPPSEAVIQSYEDRLARQKRYEAGQ